jgi:hypothetical protein
MSAAPFNGLCDSIPPGPERFRLDCRQCDLSEPLSAEDDALGFIDAKGTVQRLSIDVVDLSVTGRNARFFNDSGDGVE